MERSEIREHPPGFRFAHPGYIGLDYFFSSISTPSR
jgi:hypothetical protein